MNTIRILVKEFIQNIRNWKANLMMVLFPIVIIILLGAAFSRAFNRTFDLSDVRVLYTISSSQALADGFKSFTHGIGEELGIVFEETDNEAKGIKSMKDAKYSCFIHVSGNPDEIRLYKNSRFDFEANLMESLLKTFTQRYDALTEIAKSNPQALSSILADTSMDFVETESLEQKKQPGSLDYYAVAILTLILMYASMTGFWSIKSEQNLKTGNRILCSPVKKHEVLVGKTLGAVVVTLTQASVVILFGKYILKANWGDDLATVYLLVLAESLMAISMGAGIAFLIRNEGAAQSLLNTIIPVVVFFGGGYVPLSTLGEGIERISVISPLKWMNDALFRVIYDADYSVVPIALLINLAMAAVFITFSAAASRKEAV